ncbi:hypothetical protein ABVK25_003129 [Lepraria finkii]|uniref:Zn(2)-C6 fungal-type domain-containing protein n=1 Tax=Lepraria finkii TaxID=1340010 RepID=A0ABR4BFW9_9LECA
MLQSREQDPNRQYPPKKLRTACDVCHQTKMKCSGGTPCAGCRDSGYQCRYSVSNRIGRPKGTKNKRTLDRMSRNKSGGSDQGEPEQSWSGQPQPLTASLNKPVDNSITPLGKTSIDSILGTSMNGSNSLSGTDAFGPFSHDSNSWYDFGDLAGTSPFTQQPSSTGGFMNEEPRPYSEVDSAYVSPISVFNDKGSVGSGPKLSGLPGNISGKDDEPQNLTASTSSSSLASSATCNCVQNHAELLCRLKELEQRHTRPRLDVVLSSAQQALVPWKSVIECRVCQHDDNQEVLILSAMSIRTVLRSLQSLCSEHYNAVVSGKDSYGQEQAVADIPDGMQSAIGMYEITGEERMAVKDLLISRTLDKVKYTLTCFKERLEALNSKKKSSATSSPRKVSLPGQINSDIDRLHKGGPGDIDHLVQVWRNLDSTGQMLERVLKSVSKAKPT